MNWSLWGGAHTLPVLANHSLEEKAEGLWFLVNVIITKRGRLYVHPNPLTHVWYAHHTHHYIHKAWSRVKDALFYHEWNSQ